MKLFGLRSEFTLFIIVAGFLYLTELADGASEFRRCYNTSLEMHCFVVLYDNNNRPLITYNANARQQCNRLNSTLITIKDEETNDIVKNYTSDPLNPISNHYIWTDAYQVNDFSTYTWHWVNSALPNMPGYSFSSTSDWTWYVASLEFRSDNGKSQFYLRTQQPHFRNSYVCEYAVSRCPSTGSNVRLFADRCYVAVNASVHWYEARNRCLKDGGDLASFANVSNINFTSWLGSDPYVLFWIGLRFTWYIWTDSEQDVKFSKWTVNTGDWNSKCLFVCFNCDPNYSWYSIDCNTVDAMYVVCQTVTPLKATTLTTARATTLPVTTSDSITTQTPSNNTGSTVAGHEKSIESSPIALAVGVGVGVGVPVIAAIIVIVVCVVRRHKSKTRERSATRQESGEEAFHNEYQNNNSEAAEMGHYATVRSVAPSMPSADEESTPETHYAKLGFKETADLKNGNGQSPLNVL